jgi:hypothetical protein
MDGVSHTVEMTAATLYEAVAQALAAIRGNEWVVGIDQGFCVVKVLVADVRVEHEVKLGDFTKWLARTDGSPRDVIQRRRIRIDSRNAGLDRRHACLNARDKSEPSSLTATRSILVPAAIIIAVPTLRDLTQE